MSLDLSFEDDFEVPGMKHRDVEYMQGWGDRAGRDVTQYLGALSAILHACCHILWKNGYQAADAVLSRHLKHQKVGSVDQLLPLPVQGSGKLISFTKARSAPEYDYRLETGRHYMSGEHVATSLYALGLSTDRYFGAALVGKLPIATEHLVWSAVRRGPIQRFFTSLVDGASLSWEALPKLSDRGQSCVFLGELVGRFRTHMHAGEEAYFSVSSDSDTGQLTITAQRV